MKAMWANSISVHRALTLKAFKLIIDYFLLNTDRIERLRLELLVARTEEKCIQNSGRKT
jgi:hypothetical protein